ncbi:MAG: phosphoenolpyruvate carboxykinase [Candidatus Omnitrophica bacterium]|nr:phosphoenolpyruvate carboxykinase [Candidatus Omnitrophota bacterium]
MSQPSILPFVEGLFSRPNVRHPSDAELRGEAERFGTRTTFNNHVFHTMVKNRSAGLTLYVGPPPVQQKGLSAKQQEILKKVPQTLETVFRYLEKTPLVCIERSLGENPAFYPSCRTYISVARPEMIRIGYMWWALLFPPKKGNASVPQHLIYIPEWQEKDRQILVFPEEGVTFVLGTDYLGESKKGHLRMAMWNAKRRGMLGVHAGAKLITAKDARTGKLKRHSMLIFGLTATGKTTHSCHNHGLEDPGEKVGIVQDDVVFLKKDGSALGSERGFYLKTEGLDPETQPLLYHVATQPDAVLENVLVDYRGQVDFSDETLTTNGRGVVQWNDFGDRRAESPNLPPLSEVDGLIIAFITRCNTVVPVASKLNLEQAAAAFMLGESVESSGGDPSRAGEAVRVVGTNPFIVGDEAEEGNRFLEFLDAWKEKVSCYLLNTGGIGELSHQQPDGKRVIQRKVDRIQIPEMASIIRGIVRNTIEWEEEPLFGTWVPARVDGVGLERFDPRRFYSQDQMETLARQIIQERIAHLKQYPALDPRILDAVKMPSLC